MGFPKISIIVPSYNQGQFLEETLLSIINQNYSALELFVADGGSTDNSVEIIKKYEQHIAWWVSEKDKGQSEAINKGVKRATGEIINWICSDDLLADGALHKIAEYFTNLPDDTGVIHGGTVLFNEKKILRNDWGYADPSLERNLAGIAFSQPSAFIVKKYFDMVGGQVNETLHYGMDYDLYCRLACVSKFVPVKDIFSKYRLHTLSKSMADQDKFIGDWNRVFISLCKNLKWDDLLIEMKNTLIVSEQALSYYSPFNFPVDRKILAGADKKKILFYQYCYLFKSAYLSGDRKKARKLASILTTKFTTEWLANEKHIPQIINRLKLPEPLLKILIRVKTAYQNIFSR